MAVLHCNLQCKRAYRMSLKVSLVADTALQSLARKTRCANTRHLAAGKEAKSCICLAASMPTCTSSLQLSASPTSYHIHSRDIITSILAGKLGWSSEKKLSMR
jgi:hypothetical protein